MAEYRNNHKIGKDGLTGPERLEQKDAAKREAKAKLKGIPLRERLAIKAGTWPHPDDTVFVHEYNSPGSFKKHAKQLAKQGWVPTSQSQTRGLFIGLDKMITVSYEKKASPE